MGPLQNDNYFSPFGGYEHALPTRGHPAASGVAESPAVTVVRTGTNQAKPMLDNISGGIGRLPDEATRKRMAELIDSWPPAAR